MSAKSYIKRKGTAARGYQEPHIRAQLVRVSVAWHTDQFEAINRRVVCNNTNFAHEARRIMQIGLCMDHVSNLREVI